MKRFVSLAIIKETGLKSHVSVSRSWRFAVECTINDGGQTQFSDAQPLERVGISLNVDCLYLLSQEGNHFCLVSVGVRPGYAEPEKTSCSAFPVLSGLG